MSPRDPELEHVATAIAALAEGTPVVLVDDFTDVGGDLVIAAERITPEVVTRLAREGRGELLLALARGRFSSLKLGGGRGRAGEGLMAVRIDARHGITGGRTATERAHTLSVAASPEALPDDLVTGGAIVCVRGADGGILLNPDPIDAAIELVSLAGFTEAAVLVPILGDTGEPLDEGTLRAFAAARDLPVVSVHDVATVATRRVGMATTPRLAWSERPEIETSRAS